VVEVKGKNFWPRGVRGRVVIPSYFNVNSEKGNLEVRGEGGGGR
jgi:hypothetical protein